MTAAASTAVVEQATHDATDIGLARYAAATAAAMPAASSSFPSAVAGAGANVPFPPRPRRLCVRHAASATRYKKMAVSTSAAIKGATWATPIGPFRDGGVRKYSTSGGACSIEPAPRDETLRL